MSRDIPVCRSRPESTDECASVVRTNVTILNKCYSTAAECRKQRLLSIIQEGRQGLVVIRVSSNIHQFNSRVDNNYYDALGKYPRVLNINIRVYIKCNVVSLP